MTTTVANHPKCGLKSYSVDTGRYGDRRIKMLRRQFSCAGIAVYDYILCEIYRTNGSFLEWDESTVFEVADYFGIKENVVREVVRYCGHVGLFDKELLSCGTLTSESIQRQYLDMCGRSRRKRDMIPERYRLVGPAGETGGAAVRGPEEASGKPAALNREIDRMRRDTAWLDGLQAIHRTDTAGLLARLDEFRAQCAADGREGHLSMQDAKSHFNAWMRMVAEKERKKENDEAGKGIRGRRGPSLLRADEEEAYSDTF